MHRAGIIYICFAILFRFGTCTLAQPRFTYITQLPSNSRLSLVHDQEKNEVVLDYRDRHNNPHYAVYALKQYEGCSPLIHCIRNTGLNGAIFYDGKSIVGVGRATLVKRVSTRVFGVFFDPSSLTAPMQVIENMIISKISDSHVFYPGEDDEQVIRQVDDAIQGVFGGSLAAPRCYFAVIDPPPKLVNSKWTQTLFPGKTSSVDLSVTRQANLSVVLSRPKLIYKSGHPQPSPTFSVRDFPNKNSILFTYEKDNQSHSMTLSSTCVKDLPTLKATNDGKDGIIIFDQNNIEGSGHGVVHVVKHMRNGRVATLLFNPKDTQYDEQAFRKKVGKILFRSRVLTSETTSEEDFLKVDNAVQEVVADFFPNSPKGFLLLFDPPKSKTRKTAPESVSGTSISSLSSVPALPYSDMPNETPIISGANIDSGAAVFSKISATEYSLATTSIINSEDKVTIEISDSSIICRCDGRGTFLLFETGKPILATKDVMGATLHLSKAGSCAFALLWIESESGSLHAILKEFLQSARLSQASTGEDMDRLLGHFMQLGVTSPLILFKITKE